MCLMLDRTSPSQFPRGPLLLCPLVPPSQILQLQPYYTTTTPGTSSQPIPFSHAILKSPSQHPTHPLNPPNPTNPRPPIIIKQTKQARRPLSASAQQPFHNRRLHDIHSPQLPAVVRRASPFRPTACRTLLSSRQPAQSPRAPSLLPNLAPQFHLPSGGCSTTPPATNQISQSPQFVPSFQNRVPVAAVLCELAAGPTPFLPAEGVDWARDAGRWNGRGN